MGEKRLKLAKGPADIDGKMIIFSRTLTRLQESFPVCKNFSEISTEYEERHQEFDPGDSDFQTLQMEDNLSYEELIVLILCNLDMREKLVFIYQILRDGGYQIDHNSFAKTIGLSRSQYMRVLESVRLKSVLFIKGYKKMSEAEIGHKEP